jgi:Arc/MetJ-type ribon-helix-helix transcriptional regulator
MKLSVSLPEEDVAFLDRYARDQGIESRSAVLQRAVRLLRGQTLGRQYQQAWDEWFGGEDAALWESTIADWLNP